MRLRGDDADDGDCELLLQLWQRSGGGRVAGGDDELDALGLEERADLAGEPAHLVQRSRAVGQPGMVAEVEEVLVRQRDQTLVEDGEPAHPRVEDAHRPRIHAGDSRGHW